MAPTQHGPHGIRYDLNQGCRVLLPPGTWHVQMRDLDTGNILFDAPCSGGLVTSTRRYYVRFGIEVWQDGASMFAHTYKVQGQDVLVRMELGGLGEQLAWVGHVAAFAERHGCQVTCCVRPAVIPLA